MLMGTAAGGTRRQFNLRTIRKDRREADEMIVTDESGYIIYRMLSYGSQLKLYIARVFLSYFNTVFMRYKLIRFSHDVVSTRFIKIAVAR